jgi:hypothetical protein
MCPKALLICAAVVVDFCAKMSEVNAQNGAQTAASDGVIC